MICFRANSCLGVRLGLGVVAYDLLGLSMLLGFFFNDEFGIHVRINVGPFFYKNTNKTYIFHFHQ